MLYDLITQKCNCFLRAIVEINNLSQKSRPITKISQLFYLFINRISLFYYSLHIVTYSVFNDFINFGSKISNFGFYCILLCNLSVNFINNTLLLFKRNINKRKFLYDYRKNICVVTQPFFPDLY